MNGNETREPPLVIRGQGMTRDKAIKILRDRDFTEHAASLHVDAYIALGLLKLEEPKATSRKASDALYDAGYGGQDQSKIIAALGAAGLRIVDDGERG